MSDIPHPKPPLDLYFPFAEIERLNAENQHLQKLIRHWRRAARLYRQRWQRQSRLYEQAVERADHIDS